jgi:hypothetical protein
MEDVRMTKRPRTFMQGRSAYLINSDLPDLNPDTVAPMAMTTAGLAPAILILLVFLPLPVILHNTEL